ncbi:hypothetical protein [Mucilaginibacter sp. OK098]|uniref:hypothetical protein n=1 Tax=Mucilaginibacter sp. OK098 TaxID=1855297 RepID=UPI0009166592|nr:hypothetical protein [Mucilaginibacter sp. OK098]SHN12234.1 hypothetical protein SAMN05216524_105388 [Mucilaginibacter sp. OK098]
MIQPDKAIGTVTIDDLEITTFFSIIDIENLKKQHYVILAVNNEDYISYRIPFFDNGETAVLFTFHKGKILYVSIGLGAKNDFPEYEITEKKKAIIKDRLKSIGGEHVYRWGSVQYSEDPKGGNVGIFVRYNNNN